MLRKTRFYLNLLIKFIQIWQIILLKKSKILTILYDLNSVSSVCNLYRIKVLQISWNIFKTSKLLLKSKLPIFRSATRRLYDLANVLTVLPTPILKLVSIITDQGKTRAYQVSYSYRVESYASLILAVNVSTSF